MTQLLPTSSDRPGRGGARPGAGRKSSVSAVKPGVTARQEATSGGYFVYVVHESECSDVCKIGIAKDPMSRFSALQVGTWRQLTLACTFGVANQAVALAVESAVHQRLRDRHKRGEWFAVQACTACEMVFEAVRCT
jgi:hypothetical protein